MMVRNHPPRVARQTGHQFDTLVVSRDQLLFKQLCAFLKEFEPERKPVLVDERASFAVFENALNQCDVMICDIRSNTTSIELGAYAMECIPHNTVSIGLISDNEYSRETLNPELHLRLGGIIDNRNGWFTNWHQIAAIRQAWHNPLMMSRIEEVPVSDVFQMIAAGRWNSIVHIEGAAVSETSEPDNKPRCGCISFYQGEPQTAWSWRSAGTEAVYDLLGIRHGVLQVMKNLCAPTIRNVFMQTDEILLSHAVALDESAFFDACNRQEAAAGPDDPAATIQLPPPQSYLHDDVPAAILVPPQSAPPASAAPPAPLTPSAPAAASATSAPSITWWKNHGPSLNNIIEKAVPQTFLLRWMSDIELRRIAADRDAGGILLLYGTQQQLSKIFLAVSRGFTVEKMHRPDLFPVVRVGRGSGRFLYIVGWDIASDRSCPASVHAAAFVEAPQPAAIGRLAARRHQSLQLIAETPRAVSEGNDIAGTLSGTIPVRTLTASDLSWKGITSLLTDIIAFIADRD